MAQASPDRRNRERRMIARVCTCDRAELVSLIKQLLALLGRALARMVRAG
jgi:hypothetical protein